jgi:hypothetical protein
MGDEIDRKQGYPAEWKASGTITSLDSRPFDALTLSPDALVVQWHWERGRPHVSPHHVLPNSLAGTTGRTGPGSFLVHFGCLLSL